MKYRIVSLIWYVLTASTLFAAPVLSQPSPKPAVSVGDTMTFWSYRRSYFSLGYFQTEAFCRAVGEKCYIFVEKDRWNFGDVDSNDVAVILDAFENTTAAVDSTATGALASTAGIYDKVTSAFGPPPDFDNDPRIYILVMNVRAQGGSEWQPMEPSFLGPMSEHGYFDPVNEYSALVDSFSNEHELLYMDCLPIAPTSQTALASLAHSLQRMIHWNHDPNEERWLAEGCSFLAMFLCGYGVTTGYFPPMDPFASTYYFYSEEHGDWIWQPSAVQNSMLLHFFFEKYGEPFIQALVLDNEHQGVEAIDTILESLGYPERFSQIFENFVLTWYFLSLGFAADSTFFDGRYSLKYITPAMVRGTIVNSFLYWGLPGFLQPPYPYDWVADWSAAFIAMTADFSGDIDSVLVFNGQDDSEYSVVVIKTSSGWMEPLDPASQIEFITLDSENRGYSDVSGYKTDYRTIYMAVVFRWLVGRGTLYISDDITPPDSFHVAIFHGPIDDRSLDIYVFSTEQAISQQLYIPLVEFSYAETTDTLGLGRFRPNSEEDLPNEPHVYHGDYTLSTSGVVNVKVSGQDVSGNHAPDYSSQFSVDVVSAKTGGQVSSPDGKLVLDIPAHAMAKDTWISVFPQDADIHTANFKGMPHHIVNAKPEGRTAIGNVYRIGPLERTLQHYGVLTIRYEASDIEGIGDDLAIYRWESEGWRYIGGSVQGTEGSITTLIDRLGDYQIQAGPHDGKSASLPSTFSLSQNYPNPFNPRTSIQYSVVSDQSLPHVSLKVYNILGQEIRMLVDEVQNTGLYTVTWDGRDNRGTRVASGVYFYRLRVDGGRWSETKKMILMQ
jgi:hypothetical protein